MCLEKGCVDKLLHIVKKFDDMEIYDSLVQTLCCLTTQKSPLKWEHISNAIPIISYLKDKGLPQKPLIALPFIISNISSKRLFERETKL